MATLGKPAISPLRGVTLRELQQVIANIRERLAVLDAAVRVLQSSSTTTSSASTSTSSASSASGLSSIENGLVAKLGSNVYAARTLVVPAEFTLSDGDGVSGDPTLAWADQSANLVLASPDGLSGAPTFRALTADDVTGIFGELLTNPMTEFGDLVFGESAGSPARLPIGLDGEFLTVVAGMPVWTSVAPGSGMGNPMTDDGDIIFGQSAGSPSRLPIGAEGYVLTVSSGLPQWAALPASGGDFENPMLDYGDMIVGQSAGSPARLAPGSEGEVLTISGGVPAWEAAPTGGTGMANPMTEIGDLISGQSAGSPTRIPVGAESQVLTVVDGLPAWDDPAPGGGDMTNPMEDYGDLIIGQSAGSPARLAPGTDGQVLTMASGLPAWEAGGADPWTYLVLGSDHTTTSTSSGDVSGLQFTPDANSVYVIEAHLMIATTNTAAGARPGFLFNTGAAMGTVWIVVGQASGSVLNRFGNYLDGDNTRSNHVYAAAGSLGSTDPWPSTISAILESGGSPNAAGVTLAGETATTVTYSILAGSFLRYRKIA